MNYLLALVDGHPEKWSFAPASLISLADRHPQGSLNYLAAVLGV